MNFSAGPGVRVIERVQLIAPLGVCFWDSVSNSRIADGLSVNAYPVGNPARRAAAMQNTSGIYAFAHIPGLKPLERGAGDADYWAGVSQRDEVIVEVVDFRRRFLPFQFTATVPARGLFSLTCDSPGPPRKSVPLFSSPTRHVPAGMAVLRATLWDPLAEGPAAWAVLEARLDGQPAVRGIADQSGQVSLIFGYPEPSGASLGSPGPARGVALTEQTWSIGLTVLYAPPSPAPAVADLCRTLSQPTATIWADAARTRRLTSASLSFGRELLMRSLDSSNRPLDRGLLVTPAGSPPGSPP